jgi:hypothetical protein
MCQKPRRLLGRTEPLRGFRLPTSKSDHLHFLAPGRYNIMGAAASTLDADELRSAYAAWQTATADAPGGQLAPDAFLAMLEKSAPGLHAKAIAAGEGGGSLAAAASLQQQFVSTHAKLAERDKPAPPPPPAPPPLQKLYSWAPNKATNLQRGLAAGMLSSEPLRLVDFAIGSVKLAALLDTGAEHCAMSAAASKQCGLQPLVDESFGGTAGGIGTAQKHGRVHYAKLLLGSDVAAAVGASATAPAPAKPAVADVKAPAAATTSDNAEAKVKEVAGEKKAVPPTATATANSTQAKVKDTTSEKQAAADAQSAGSSSASATCHYYEVAFDVMEFPPHVTFDAIIGIDFLVRHRAKIDLVDGTVALDSNGVVRSVELRKAVG